MRFLFSCCLVAAMVASSPAPMVSQGRASATGPVVEIRSYNLKPGTRDRFHKRFVADALPLLNRAEVDVVAYGPSLHDADSYYLIRAFPGIEERQKSEDAFYGSEAWTKGPREATLADIDTYTTIVVPLDDATLQALRKSLGPAR
jgi:hypothetical protein